MITLKRELKEVQDEAALEKEKLARLRLTCEQQGKQLRSLRGKEAAVKDAKALPQPAPPAATATAPDEGAAMAAAPSGQYEPVRHATAVVAFGQW